MALVDVVRVRDLRGGAVVARAVHIVYRRGRKTAGPEGPGSRAREPVGVHDGGEAAGKVGDRRPVAYVSWSIKRDVEWNSLVQPDLAA